MNLFLSILRSLIDYNIIIMNDVLIIKLYYTFKNGISKKKNILRNLTIKVDVIQVSFVYKNIIITNFLKLFTIIRIILNKILISTLNFKILLNCRVFKFQI